MLHELQVVELPGFPSAARRNAITAGEHMRGIVQRNQAVISAAPGAICCGESERVC